MSVSDNRDNKYIAKGKNEVSANLNTANNTAEMVCTEGVQPTDSGEITVTVTMGENNTNGTGFYYLNAMRVVPRGSLRRSEGHTSELQSLMRITYAGFCLKKKNKTQIQNAEIKKLCNE